MRIVLGVTGGIAAYKSAYLLRRMTEAGHDVHVVPTEASLNFIGAATWEALSGNPVHTDTFEAVDTVNHVAQGRHADLVVVAPATADFIARTAHGLAPDLLGNIMLTATCPVLVVPAMHTEMWHNSATVDNVALLRSRGIEVMEPAIGRLTGEDSGKGRFPEPDDIWAYAQGLASAHGDLAGQTIVISAGGTREALDPVRYLGNRSSGKQGVALAQAALERGANVRLITGAVSVDIPAHPRLERVRIESTAELLEAVLQQATGADALIMAAAVADFRPVSAGESKIKKTSDTSTQTIELTQTADVLATTVKNRTAGDALPPVIIGFAAETGDAHGTVLDYGKAKLERKGCEMLVLNEVGTDKTFGHDDNAVTILFADGADPVEAQGSKLAVSQVIVDQLVSALHKTTTTP